MQAVILAAGSSSRLLPASTRRSKAMMPILGIPIIERIIENLDIKGIAQFIVVVSPHDNDIVQYFREKSRFQSRVRLITQPQALGTADALNSASPLIDSDFLLSSCDNLVESHEISKMLDHWNARTDPKGLLAVMPMQARGVRRSSLVEMAEEEVISIVEKPSGKDLHSGIASLPLYIFSPLILSYLNEVQSSIRGEREIQDAVQLLIDRHGKVGIFSISERMTLTSPLDLLAINLNYLKLHYPLTFESALRCGQKIKMISPVHVEEGIEIGQDCVIGPNVYAEQGSRIGNCVTLRNSVLLKGAFIADGVTVSDTVVF